MNVKGIIVDWAGTVVDYGCMAPTQVFIEVFKERGINITMEEARGPMGLAKRDHVAALLALDTVKIQWKDRYGSEPGEGDLDDIYGQLEPKLADIVDQFAKVIPGVPEFCEKIQSMGVKIGSTTGYVAGMMEKIIPLAEQQGFKPDSIVSSSDKSAGRPLPWMVYENAERMGVYPLSAMVKIGDTVADISEGLNAGMWTIGVSRTGNEVGLNEEQMAQADVNLITERVAKAEKKLYDAGAHYVVESVADSMSVLQEISDKIARGERP